MLGKEYQEGWDSLKTFVYREYGIEQREESMELADVVLKMVEKFQGELDKDDWSDAFRNGMVVSFLVNLKSVAESARGSFPKETFDPNKLSAIGVPSDVAEMTHKAILREQEKRKNRAREWEERGQRDGVQFALCEGGSSDGCMVEIPPTLSDGTNVVVGTQSYVFRGGKLRVWEE